MSEDGKTLLFLSSTLPFPPGDGGKVVTWNLAKCLNHNGWQLDLLCYAGTRELPPTTRERLSTVFSTVTSVHKDVERQHLLDLVRALSTRSSYFVRKYETGSFTRSLNTLLDRRRYDATLLSTPYLGVFLSTLLARKSRCGRIILRLQNVESELLEQLAESHPPGLKKWLLEREAGLFRPFETETILRAEDVYAISQRDRRVLIEQCDKPIGLLEPLLDFDDIEVGTEQNIRRFSLLSVGDMRWPPNRNGARWFLSRVWPVIRDEYPLARCRFVGQSPPAEAESDGDPRVEAPGFVDDIYGYLKEAHLFIAPILEGSGVRIKILTALAHGKQVLSTPVGAEDIDFDGLLIRDGEDSWIEAIRTVFESSPLVSREAVRYCRERHSWRRPLDLVPPRR